MSEEETAICFQMAFELNPIVRSILASAQESGKMRVAPRIEELCRQFFLAGAAMHEIYSEVLNG